MVVAGPGGWVSEDFVGVIEILEEFVCGLPLGLLGFLIKSVGVNLFYFGDIGLPDFFR